MKQTGVFFHHQEGERLKDFPEALGNILSYDSVLYCEPAYTDASVSFLDYPIIENDLLYRIHDIDMVRQVKSTPDFWGALVSASGTVDASRRIFNNDINNAFVFTGFGDHHAGTSFFGGGCYFNGAAIALTELRQLYDIRKIAILDTDAHHGDGTWNIFEQDNDVLYSCFCREGNPSINNNFDIELPQSLTDESYLALVESEFISGLSNFKPSAIFWNFGYDGTLGDYGDLGITRDFHVALAKLLKKAADQLCSGRLLVVLCGGSNRQTANQVIPRIIEVLIGSEDQF